jgi:protocatechuate 3,4-dioxygenase beta subunit
LLGAAASAAIWPLAARGAAFAPTPTQTAGPFYPSDAQKPADRDGDLVRLHGRAGNAAGSVIHVTGRVLRPDGSPIANAHVEIWQANAKGTYNHPSDGHDPNFQGYGAVDTDRAGRYAFRTIKPAAYGSAFFRRTPHIHFRITAAGLPPLVTQMYFAGDPLNRQDGILNAVEDVDVRARLIVPFRESPQIEPGSHAGQFNIVLEG